MAFTTDGRRDDHAAFAHAAEIDAASSGTVQVLISMRGTSQAVGIR